MTGFRVRELQQTRRRRSCYQIARGFRIRSSYLKCGMGEVNSFIYIFSLQGHLVRAPNFPKKLNMSYPLIRTRACHIRR